jgi:hypothetical protein
MWLPNAIASILTRLAVRLRYVLQPNRRRNVTWQLRVLVMTTAGKLYPSAIHYTGILSYS